MGSQNPSRGLFLFRALFPTWRFFEDLGDFPILHYRISSSQSESGQWTPWRVCLPKQKRTWLALLYNPHVNLQLAHQSLLQQLLADLEELDPGLSPRLEDNVSYQLTKNLVEETIRRQQVEPPARFQFKLSTASVVESAPQDLLLSPEYEI